MSNFKAEAYTPATIGTVKFRIPLYQRPYAWGNFQVEQLMKDLEYQFVKDRSQKYYIGILNVGKTTNDKELFDLIDGQQRITTLNLIGRVLKDHYPIWESFLHKRLELFGRKEDQLYLEKLDMSEHPNPKMPEAVDCIKNYVEKYVFDKSGFSKYVFENASFFITEVPEQYTLIEKNLQFVRMNNRGKQLEPHDVLKIKLATEIKDDVRQKDFIKRWNLISQLGCNSNALTSELQEEKSLYEIITSFENLKEPDRESEIFYQSIVSFPEFLLIALDRYLKKINSNVIVSHTKEKQSKEYRKDRLLEEFGFGEKIIEFNWTDCQVSGFMDTLDRQFQLFDRFIIKRDKEDKYKFNEKYKDNLNGGLISLLNLQVFQSFLYVSREPSQHNWLIDAFDYLEKSVAGDKIETGDFLTYLKLMDIDNIKDVDELSLNYGKIERHWFWRLDYYIWEKRESVFEENPELIKIADKYTFRINRSIEHIAPQNPNKSTFVHITETYKHCFGNLAMISSGQNSSLQNEPFEIKRAHVELFINGIKGGTIESLKMLDIYAYNTWDEDNLKKHSNKMINVLINSLSGNSDNLINLLKKHLYENKTTSANVPV